jgi:hypothetical protein
MTNMRLRQLLPHVTVVIGLALVTGCGSSSSTPSTVPDGGGSNVPDASGGGSSDVPVVNTPDSGGTTTADSGGTTTADGSGVFGSSPFKCLMSSGGGGGSSACTKAENDAYYKCALSKCAPAFNTCYGPNFATTGQVGGTCGTLVNCANACACTDFNCLGGCFASADPCLTCIDTAATQCEASCPAPPCMKGPDAGVALKDGGFNIPDLGLAGGTCADLKACCDGMADASGKATCNMAYAAVQPAGDSSCSVLLSSYKLAGTCH